jgi:5-methylcytosine-specific restriction protein B
MVDEHHSIRRSITSFVSRIISKYGVQHSISGGKFDDLRQPISTSTGYWADRTFVAKPSRLIVHFWRDEDGEVRARIPQENDNGNFAYANTAHRPVGALLVRVQPVIDEQNGTFHASDECEWLLWYCFWPALKNGSSGQLFDGFDPRRGTFTYMGDQQPYIAAGLVMLNSPDQEVHESDGSIAFAYAEATDALRRILVSAPTIDGQLVSPPRPIPVYEAYREASMERMAVAIDSAFMRATASVLDEEDEPDGSEPEPDVPPEVPVLPDLIGMDPEVYRQINAAIRSNKQHLLFYGPPGTGKTTLAEEVAAVLSEQWKLITGSADWTSQDVIGGYHPLEGGKLKFLPGFLLKHFDKPVIFDELNRCDIDKVIGPLFTVLSGQSTTLPYLTDPADENSPRIEILPTGTPNPPQTYAPLPKWRLIATINSIDKASLYQMSYALTRRFAWIYVDAPADPHEFLRRFMARHPDAPQAPANAESPLGHMWTAINEARRIGAAPIIDIIKMIRSQNPTFNFFAPVARPEDADPYLDGFYVTLLPMLDGILWDQGETVADGFRNALNLGDDRRAVALKERIRALTI